MDQDHRVSPTESPGKKTGRTSDRPRTEPGADHSSRQVKERDEPRVQGRYSPEGDVLPSEDDRHNGP